MYCQPFAAVTGSPFFLRRQPATTAFKSSFHLKNSAYQTQSTLTVSQRFETNPDVPLTEVRTLVGYRQNTPRDCRRGHAMNTSLRQILVGEKCSRGAKSHLRVTLAHERRYDLIGCRRRAVVWEIGRRRRVREPIGTAQRRRRRQKTVAWESCWKR